MQKLQENKHQKYQSSHKNKNIMMKIRMVNKMMMDLWRIMSQNIRLDIELIKHIKILKKIIMG